MVPQTIASETAQNTNSKKNLAAAGAVDAALRTGRFIAEPGWNDGAKPVTPMMLLVKPVAAPNAKAKPQTQYTIELMLRLTMTLATTVPTFFIRVKPTSSIAKPACMKSTKHAATMTQTVSAAIPAAAWRWRLRACAVRAAGERRGAGDGDSDAGSSVNGVLLGVTAFRKPRNAGEAVRRARRHKIWARLVRRAQTSFSATPPSEPPTRREALADAQAEVQVETRGRVVEAQAADLLDATQAIEDGVAVQVEALGCVGRRAVAVEEGVEGVHQA